MDALGTGMNTSGGNYSGDPNRTFVTAFSVPFYRSMFIVIYSLIFVVCVVGNVLVLFVTTKSAHMKTRTYFFLANLAVADLCVGVLCIIPNLLKFLYLNKWVLGQALCKIHYFVENFSFCASVLLLAVIAMERYIVVLHPLKAKGVFTKCRMHALQAAIWISAAVYNVPLLLTFHTYSVPSGSGNGTMDTFCYMDYIDLQIFYTFNFVLWYAIPLLIMLFVYIVIAWTLWNSGSIFTTATTDTNSNENGNRLIPPSREERSEAVTSSSGTSSGLSDSRCHQGVLKGCSTKNGIKVSFCCAQPGNNVEVFSESEGRADSPNLPSFGSIDSGLARSPSHAESNNAHRKKTSILMCWPQVSPNDAPNYEIIPLSCANSNTRSTNAQPSNYFELGCMNSHDNNHQRQQDLRQRVLIHQSSRRNTWRRSTINSEMAIGNYSTPSALTRETRTRYMTTSLRVLSSRRKVVRMLIILLITFAVCVLPHHVRLLMVHWNGLPKTTFPMTFFPPITFICLYLNSALNPVLYSLFSESFRRSLRECARKPWQRWRSFISKINVDKPRRDRPG